MAKYKLYDSEASAVKAGCCKDQLETKNGVCYCRVDCDIEVEAEVVKPDTKKKYKG